MLGGVPVVRPPWVVGGASARRLRAGRLPVELVDRALRRRFVVAPAQQPGAVADAPGTDLVKAPLDHEFGAQRDPLQLLGRAPAARVGAAALAGLVRREGGHELALLLGLEPAGVADHLHLAIGGAEPDAQR